MAGRKPEAPEAPEARGTATAVMLICRRLSVMQVVIVSHGELASEREVAPVWHKLQHVEGEGEGALEHG